MTGRQRTWNSEQTAGSANMGLIANFVVLFLAWLGKLHTPKQPLRVVISASWFSFISFWVILERNNCHIAIFVKFFRLFTVFNFS